MLKNVSRISTGLFRMLLCVSVIAGLYSCKDSKGNEQKSVPDTRRTAWVIASDGLRLRSSSDSRSAIIGAMPFGAEVLILEETGATLRIAGKFGQWSKVIWQGKTGWAFGGFLSDKKPKALKPVAWIFGNWEMEKEKGSGINTLQISRTNIAMFRYKEHFNGSITSLKKTPAGYVITATGTGGIDTGPGGHGPGTETLTLRIRLLGKQKFSVSITSSARYPATIASDEIFVK